MPSRSFVRRALLATPFLTALFAGASARIALADEPPAAPPAQPAPPPDASAASTSPAADPPKPTATDSPKASVAPAPDDLDGMPARPPPLEPPPSKSAPWERLLDVGGSFAVVTRPSKSDVKGRPSAVRYEAATGFGLHIRWPLLTHLAIEGYYLDFHMPVVIPRGALGLADTVTSPPVETYVFGVRLSPSMTWGPITGRLTAGAGWGRFEFQRMEALTSGGESYVLRERGGSFVEIPVGFGFSWEVVERWLSIDIVGTGAFVAGQHGDAFDPGQTADPAGKLHDLRGLPVIEASFVQTIGFSLLL